MSERKILHNKNAIVTGGGRGIGKAISIRLADLGARVVVAGTTKRYLDETAGEIAARGGQATPVVCDVANEGAVLELFKRSGAVDILINNAGVGRFCPIAETTAEDWDLVLGVNLRGVFFCCREAMKNMAGRGGRVINIASVVGIKGYKDQGAYTASKHGLMGLSKVMAVEGMKDNIITQVIAPGGVDTGMIGDARPDLDRSDMMTPEDIADSVEFLLRQNGNAVTDLIQMRRRIGSPW